MPEPYVKKKYFKPFKLTLKALFNGAWGVAGHVSLRFGLWVAFFICNCWNTSHWQLSGFPLPSPGSLVQSRPGGYQNSSF